MDLIFDGLRHRKVAFSPLFVVNQFSFSCFLRRFLMEMAKDLKTERDCIQVGFLCLAWCRCWYFVTSFDFICQGFKVILMSLIDKATSFTHSKVWILKYYSSKILFILLKYTRTITSKLSSRHNAKWRLI